MHIDPIFSRREVVEARMRFYAARKHTHGGHCTASFETLYALYADTRLTMKERARRVGVAQQTLHRLYDTYYCVLFGGKTCKERYDEHHRAIRTATRAKAFAEQFRAFPWIKHFYASAVAAGHTVLPEVVGYTSSTRTFPHLLKRTAVVSGCRCLVFPIRQAWPTGAHGGSYARTEVIRETLESAPVALFPMLVSVTDLETLVMRTEELVEFLYGKKAAKKPQLYIPLRGRLEGLRSFSQLDPYQHNNRWDLIPREVRENVRVA